MTKEEQGKVIWKAMEILMELSKVKDKPHKLETAYQLRVIYDIHYRDPDGHWLRR